MNDALVLRDYGRLSFAVTPEAERLKSCALEQSSLIGAVTTAEANEAAVFAQRELKRVLKLVEDARKEVKAPIIDYGRVIDATCKEFAVELESEHNRIEQVVSDYAQVILAAQRSAEAARSNTLTEIELEREEALAKAETVDERDQITADYNDRIAALSPPAVTEGKAEGQIVREEWEFEVYDMEALYRHWPECVKVEPRKAAIKEKLALGIKLPGVRAWKKVKAGVRLAPGGKEIEV